MYPQIRFKILIKQVFQRVFCSLYAFCLINFAVFFSFEVILWRSCGELRWSGVAQKWLFFVFQYIIFYSILQDYFVKFILKNVNLIIDIQ